MGRFELRATKGASNIADEVSESANRRQPKDDAPHVLGEVFRTVSRRDAGAGAVIWFTGLSGAGKSTLAEALALRLREGHGRVEVLDGDLVRTHLSRGLGFSREDRDTNVARIAFVAHLLARNGVLVITAAISPYRATRDAARRLIGDFFEIHVAPPLGECIRRDVKGLYRKAIAGEIPSFTGISDPYEEPLAPELRLDTSTLSVDDGVERTLALLKDAGYLDAASAASAAPAPSPGY